MSPLVNTEAKMPKKMFDALDMHEAFCTVQGIFEVSEDSVRKWLAERYGDFLASQFKPEYLLNSQGPSKALP